MKLRFIALFSLLLTAQLAFAQVELRWDSHGVGFSVPSDFKVEANNADEFVASNENLYLTINPFQDENVTEENLAEALVAMAEGLEYDALDKVAEANGNDFTGYYVLGTKDGVHVLLLTLLDTQSSTNLLITITYADGAEPEAMAMANSFFAYD